MKHINQFNDFIPKFEDKNAVHPLVVFLRESEGYSWQSLADHFSESLGEKGIMLKVSRSNVRNYATGRTNAWWFWPEVSLMIVTKWASDREKGIELKERRECDLFFSGLFSEDLKQVYSYRYAASKLKRLCVSETNEACKTSINQTLAIAETLATSVVNQTENIYSVSFPE